LKKFVLPFGGCWGSIGRGGAGRDSRGRENNLTNIRAANNLGGENNLVGRGMAIVWHLLFLKVLRVRAIHFSGAASLLCCAWRAAFLEEDGGRGVGAGVVVG